MSEEARRARPNSARRPRGALSGWTSGFSGLSTVSAVSTERPAGSLPKNVHWVRTSGGNYQITFAAPLANTNYVVAGTAQQGGANMRYIVPVTRGTQVLTIQTRGTNSAGDSTYVGVIIFGSNVPGASNHTNPSGGFGGGTWGWGVLP